MDKAQTVEYYMKLPYTIELQRDPDEGWFIWVKELRGCMSQGETLEEALKMIQDAMHAWIEVSLEDGTPIPKPRPAESYSGKFVVRVPRSLHRQLSEAAQEEGVSLNQFINMALASAIERRTVFHTAPHPLVPWSVPTSKVLATPANS